MSSDGGSLGSHRLSVRNFQNRKQERPSAGQTQFASTLDYEKLALTAEPTYRAVPEGTTRRIETATDGIDALQEYIENKKNASLVLEEEISGDVKVLPYNHRWTDEYRSMTYAKLKQAERALKTWHGEGPIPTTLLSLTAHQTDEKGDPRPIGDVLNDLLEGWDRFRRVLRRATSAYDTEYIRVIEPHQSGYPHLHVVIFGAALPSLESKVQDIWVEKYGVGGADAHAESVTIARGRQAQLMSPAAYVMKYLSKTMVRSDGDQQKVEGYEAFSALLWATGARQFSASAGLSSAMKLDRPISDKTERWRFVGVGYGLEPGSYEGEIAAELVEHVDGGPWRPPPGPATVGFVRYGELLN